MGGMDTNKQQQVAETSSVSLKYLLHDIISVFMTTERKNDD